MSKKANLFLFLLLSLILLSAGSTCAATVFGPQTLTINRWHYHCSYDSFSVNTAGKGTLVITRTASEKTIKGGFILYNSRIIPLRKFFRGAQDTLTKKIRIHKKNRLFIFLRGKPGAAITITIEQKDGVQPPEAALTVDPVDIIAGESAMLNWSTTHTNSVSIEPGIGTVGLTGSVSISPLQTTEYTLTATGSSGTATARASINVTPPPKPTVTFIAEPDIITPGSSSILSWSSEHAIRCILEPDIGIVACNGSRSVIVNENTTYTISTIGLLETAKAQVNVQVYPVKVHEIAKAQAHYRTPENTIAASTSALLQQDLDWYYQTFTVETAAQDKKMFLDAGIGPKENFTMVRPANEEYIIDKISYQNGILLISEIHRNDIDGTILKTWAGLVLENDIWKITYNFSEDIELHEKYNDVIYTNCVATYRFSPSAFLEDSAWHNNDLTNYNETGVALDKRFEKDLTTAVFNGINNGLGREVFNDMPREQISMGGWIKADSIDHTARIMEIGRDRNDSTAIVLDPGKGLRYWIHVDGRRVERTAAMDYDFHDNQWHHVYLTYDGAVMKLYVDAQLKDSYPVSGTIDSAAVLNIGQHNGTVFGGTSNTFKGRLDDLQIYNKPLTAEEILAKYENGTS